MAFDIVQKVFPRVQCEFNNDYDCDGIPNNLDNCPRTYNPNQVDLNHNGIGDVCDDDIDGDGIKNPKGIVDRNGNINTVLITPSMDNCIFTPNHDQKDTSHNGIDAGHTGPYSSASAL